MNITPPVRQHWGGYFIFGAGELKDIVVSYTRNTSRDRKRASVPVTVFLWVGEMNNIWSRAREVVNTELIYN